MSQRIYLDDCAYAKELVRLLVTGGHQVITPRQAGTTGREDEVHIRYAAEHSLILLTKNPGDFFGLHQKDSKHAGSSWCIRTMILTVI